MLPARWSQSTGRPRVAPATNLDWGSPGVPGLPQFLLAVHDKTHRPEGRHHVFSIFSIFDH